MLIKVDARNRIAERAVLRTMFEARKRVFIDLLRWDIPALDDRYEIDQFDDGHAHYLVLLDGTGRHLASARLLSTMRPGILSSLFDDLCDTTPPSGDTVFEITRFCLSPTISAAERRICRNKLVTALVLFAQDNGITAFTGVAELSWFRQILRFGWDCRALGPPRTYGGSTLAALRIDIAADTLLKLDAAGIFIEPTDPLPAMRAA